MNRQQRIEYVFSLFNKELENEVINDNETSRNCNKEIVNNFDLKDSKIILLNLSRVQMNDETQRIWISEQLEVAIQLLVNEEYRIIVHPCNKEDDDLCKEFVYIFQSHKVVYLEHMSEIKEILQVIEKCILTINLDEKYTLFSLSASVPFIFLGLSNNFEKFSELNFGFAMFENYNNINAGNIIKKINYVVENMAEIERYFRGTFRDEYIRENIDKFGGLENYAIKVKQSIEEFINSDEFHKAKNLIDEYESIVQNDVEIYSMKAILAIREGNLSFAREKLIAGTEIYKDNFDLYYNLGYVSNKLGDYDEAIKYYSHALKLTEDEELIEEINKCIYEIKSTNSLSDCEIIIKNTDGKFAPKYGNDIYEARRNVTEAMLDNNSLLVSVMVLAYNNLEKYTKTCVECILKYTADINYELVLVDNGSNDGTFEYFKTVNHPRKRIIKIAKNIGAAYGAYQGYVNFHSKYFIVVANDIYVTKNWLSNMIKCAESDAKIGIVNPVSDYVSNFQSVDLEFDNFEDMQKKAAIYNVSDPRKWEERLRLITLGTLFKRECLDVVGFMDYGFFHDFGDDDIVFRVRRAGYKAILCKDTFICHAGKITDKGAEISRKSLEIGKKNFRDKYYGIDAWDDVNNYEKIMMTYVTAKERHKIETPNILGIDVLCGTPILEVKNKLRNQGIMNARLSSFSTEAKYWMDLSTICDGKVEVDRIDYLSQHFTNEKFDYVILGKEINKYEQPYRILEQVLELLKDDGEVLLKVKNPYNIMTLLRIMNMDCNMSNELIYNISIEDINQYLQGKIYYIRGRSAELYMIDKNIDDKIRNFGIDFKASNIYKKSLVQNFIVSIIKNN